MPAPVCRINYAVFQYQQYCLLFLVLALQQVSERAKTARFIMVPIPAPNCEVCWKTNRPSLPAICCCIILSRVVIKLVMKLDVFLTVHHELTIY